jgi:hypothetical protein
MIMNPVFRALLAFVVSRFRSRVSLHLEILAPQHQCRRGIMIGAPSWSKRELSEAGRLLLIGRKIKREAGYE